MTTAVDFSNDYSFGWRTAPDKRFPTDRRLMVRTYHGPGTHSLLADGTVRFISENIDNSLWKSLCTRAGGEAVGEF